MYEIFEKLLQRHGVTTYQVSKATLITQSTFSNWKSRRNLISSENGKKIAEYFNVSLDYLMGNNLIEEMGRAIQDKRIKQGISRSELADESKIAIEVLESYEEDDTPIREDIFEDIARALGTSYFELIEEYGLYDQFIPPYFNGDVVRYEEFKKARDKDAMAERSDDEDVLLISRLAKNMKPENRKKLIDMAKIMFAEDFDD